MNENDQLKPKADPPTGGWLSISEAAKYLRVSKDTLRRWEKEKIIKAYRSPTNRRYYKKDELEYVFNQKPEISEEPTRDLSSSRQAQDQDKEKRLPLVIIVLLATYIILMIFLAWLLLQSQ